MQASTVPNCRAYDPCFAGEFAVILDHGMRQMLEQHEDVFYYVTLIADAPVVMASDYVRAWPQLIASDLQAPVTTLGTDGFGRSDTRAALRSFFEVDRFQIVLAALTALRAQGLVDAATCTQAIAKYSIAPEQLASWTC